MKKQYRLLKSEDFKTVMDAHKKYKEGALTIFARPNELDHVRIGLSVSKKVGKAHVRVKIRRQLRACFDLLKIFDFNYDIVVIVHQEFLNKTFDENLTLIKKAIENLTKKEVKR